MKTRVNPAITKVRRLLKTINIPFTQPYPGSFKFMGDNLYAVNVDLEYSARESKVRLIVCGLCDESDIYAQIREAFHKVEVCF